MFPEKQADISLTKLQDEVERMCQEGEVEEGELNEEEGEVDTTTSANPASWELQQRVPVRASSRKPYEMLLLHQVQPEAIEEDDLGSTSGLPTSN